MRGIVEVEHALQAGDRGRRAGESAATTRADLVRVGRILGVIDADDAAPAEVERIVQRARLGLAARRRARRSTRIQGGRSAGSSAARVSVIALLDHQQHVQQVARIVEPRQAAHQARGDVGLAVKRHDDRHDRQARDGRRAARAGGGVVRSAASRAASFSATPPSIASRPAACSAPSSAERNRGGQRQRAQAQPARTGAARSAGRRSVAAAFGGAVARFARRGAARAPRRPGQAGVDRRAGQRAKRTGPKSAVIQPRAGVRWKVVVGKAPRSRRRRVARAAAHRAGRPRRPAGRSGAESGGSRQRIDAGQPAGPAPAPRVVGPMGEPSCVPAAAGQSAARAEPSRSGMAERRTRARSDAAARQNRAEMRAWRAVVSARSCRSACWAGRARSSGEGL